MKFVLNTTVAALIPESITDRVQNGVDTEFTAAHDAGLMDQSAKWRGSLKKGTGDKPDAVKVRQTLKTKWELQANAPGKLILLSIYMDTIENEVGEMGVAALPDVVTRWFARLEAEAKKSAPAPAPAPAS